MTVTINALIAISLVRSKMPSKRDQHCRHMKNPRSALRVVRQKEEGKDDRHSGRSKASKSERRGALSLGRVRVMSIAAVHYKRRQPLDENVFLKGDLLFL